MKRERGTLRFSIAPSTPLVHGLSIFSCHHENEFSGSIRRNFRRLYKSSNLFCIGVPVYFKKD